VLLGQPVPHQMPAGQLVAAPGAHQQQPLFPQAADQVGEELQARGVCPVQILDQQHDRRVTSELAEQAVQHPKQPCPAARVPQLVGTRVWSLR
jgi:hypothetical protein